MYLHGYICLWQIEGGFKAISWRLFIFRGPVVERTSEIGLSRIGRFFESLHLFLKYPRDAAVFPMPRNSFFAYRSCSNWSLTMAMHDPYNSLKSDFESAVVTPYKRGR